ncbi:MULTISPECIES: hypothetical protein [Streptomyces violaceusniger group]|uniref:Uncharacterized protein n=2 Tax=Streptomyces rhizosphaericus TaxID=114699 RepID=A0ABN1S674_9ACTN|nr:MULTISPECIES: hypothetical protein [Streptomyces violaceusniger group]
MDATHLAVDGYLDTVPTPGDSPGTARFQLIVSPTDTVADDVVWACATGEPRIAQVLLTEVQPGDLLRVTGFLTQPDDAAAPVHLSVDALEVLAAAPMGALHGMVLDRYGPYRCVFDADTTTVPVFTEHGAWVGEAPNPVRHALRGFFARHLAAS